MILPAWTIITNASCSITSARNRRGFTRVRTKGFPDTAGYALTRLPARYMWHDIDMAFYPAAGERESLLQNARQTVGEAAEFNFERREANAG